MSEPVEVKKGYKESPLGFIPEDWKLEELGIVAKVNMGQSPPSSSYNENGDGLPLIQGNADIKNRLAVPRVWTSEPSKECESDEIIMTVRAPVGAVAKSTIKACIGRGVCSIRSTNEANSEFIYQHLISLESKWSKLEQGSTFTAVNGSDIRSLKIPIPPLPEQKKIAEILTTVDDKIAVIEERIKQTQELKKGLMHRLLNRGIGHTEFKDSPLGEIPVSWEVKVISDVAEVKGGKRLPKGHSLQEDATAYPYIRVSDMYMGGVSFDDILYVPSDIQDQISRYTISKNDLFISVAGTLGIVGKIPVELDGANLTENADKLTNIGCHKEYLFQLLLSELIQKTIKDEQTNNAQPKLALTRIKEFKIPIPPHSEQIKIAEILTSVDNNIEVLHEKKSSYQELKKGLMQQLLTGKTRVVTD